MKILILGDFSGLGINLKKGLIKLGVNASLISNGDGWKKINGSDIHLLSYYKKNNKHVNTIERIIIGILNRIKLLNFAMKNKKSFDKVFVINTGMITSDFMDLFRITFSMRQIRTMLKNKKEIYLSASGEDFYFLTEGLKHLEYSHYDDVQELRAKIKRYAKKEKKIDFQIKKIIPVMHEYRMGYINSLYNEKKMISKIIPLPIDSSAIKYNENLIKDKIVIFHGINRSEAKGSKEIIKALEIIKEKYPEKVKIVIKERLPLVEYLEYLKDANIILDQCKSYSYGMNALLCMTLGKVVFSGNNEVCRKAFEEEFIPIVNITPNIDEIVEKLSIYIEKKELIVKIGKEAREFVEKKHDILTVAQCYLEVFNE